VVIGDQSIGQSVISQSVVSQFWESPAEILASAVSHAGGIMVVNGRPHWSIWKPKLAISLVLIAIASLLLFAASQLSVAQASAPRTARPVIRLNIQQTTLLTATDTYTYYFPLVFRDYRVPTWHSAGLQANSINVIAVDPISPSVLYAGVFGAGVYKSSDSGTSWHLVNDGLPVSPKITQVVIDPKQHQNVYATLTYYPRFYYSRSGGQSWQPGGQVSLIPCALSTHPTIAGRLLMGVCAWDTWGGGGQLYKSDDDGLNWTEVFSKQVVARSIVAAPSEPLLVYAGGLSVYRSNDGGDNWTQVNAGLPDSQVWNIAIHPTQSLTVYATTLAGVFKTMDGGDTWSSWGISLPANGLRELRISRRDPSIQYATSDCSGVYVSLDEGQHWQPINYGLGNLCVNDIALDSSSLHLYAATEDGIWQLDLTNGVQQ
jgi:photosystem II stability/assembly factor-like uncharacterized protein